MSNEWTQTLASRRRATLLVMLLLVSACGSTAEWNQTMSLPGTPTSAGRTATTSDGLAAPPNIETRDTGQVLSGSGNEPTSAASSDRDNKPRETGAVNENPMVAGQKIGPGFTKDKIYIGYGTWNGANKTLGALGAGTNFGNQEDIAKAMAEKINSQGGIADRQIELVFYDYENADIINNPNAGAQKACTRWTEDRRVFAVQNNIGPTGDRTLISCLSQRGVPLVSGALGMRPSSIYMENSPHVWQPSGATLERLIHQLIGRLNINGYFAGWDANRGAPSSAVTPKIGITARRDVYGAETVQIAKRELGRIGYSVSAEWQYSGQVSSGSNEAQEAVVRFREKNVTHVIALGSGTAFFFQAAASQQYWPRYGMSSNSAPRQMQEINPNKSFIGAMGVGFLPTVDVDAQHHPDDMRKNERNCRSAMQNSGLDTSNRDNWSLMAVTCDGFDFLKGAVEAGTPSPAGIQGGAERMDTIVSAATFGINFNHNRFDGASATRDVEYRTRCECFVYSSNENYGM